MRPSAELIEYLVLFGIIGFIVFVPMTQLLLGLIITLLGAFLPARLTSRASGQGSIKFAGLKVSMAGSLRVGVICAGLLVIGAALLEGRQSASRSPREVAAGLVATRAVVGPLYLVPQAAKDQQLSDHLITKRNVQRNVDFFREMYNLGCPHGEIETENIPTAFRLSEKACFDLGDGLYN